MTRPRRFPAPNGFALLLRRHGVQPRSGRQSGPRRNAPRLSLLFLLLLATASLAPSQSFDLRSDRLPVTSLDGFWRFHPGDDPRWSDPGFDDSSWPLLRSDRSWYTQGYPGLSGYAWYRFTLRVPSGGPPLSLMLRPIATSYQLYVDGRLLGGREPTSTVPVLHVQAFPLPAPTTDGTLHVALRVWHAPIWSKFVAGGPIAGGSLAGDRPLIEGQVRAIQQAGNLDNMDFFLDAFLRAIIGLAVLGLFLLRPGEREYLWFAAIELFGAADDLLYFFHVAYGTLSIQAYDLVDAILAGGFWVAGLFFVATVLRRPRDLWFRCSLIALFLSPLAVLLYWWGTIPVPTSGTLQTLCVLPSLVWVIYTLVVRSWRGDRDARLLLAPLLLVDGFYLVGDALAILKQAGVLPSAPYLFLSRIPLSPFPVGFYILFNILFTLAMLAFLILRFSSARRHEEYLRGELEAAGQVQQLLLPTQSLNLSHLRIETVYLPAETVGGDFFQQLPDGRGGLFLVIGDVAGKGLPAAMVVSLLVGAIRSEVRRCSSPAALLSALNDRLVERAGGGFATCLAAFIASDGAILIANAGHIPPYCQGVELPLPPSLPLGVSPGMEYDVVPLSLAPGETLTFLTDGVVEAQSAAGELFGFERTAAISRQPAEAIAAAAHRFGQRDDITVLTLTLTPVPAPIA